MWTEEKISKDLHLQKGPSDRITHTQKTPCTRIIPDAGRFLWDRKGEKTLLWCCFTCFVLNIYEQWSVADFFKFKREYLSPLM